MIELDCVVLDGRTPDADRLAAAGPSELWRTTVFPWRDDPDRFSTWLGESSEFPAYEAAGAALRRVLDGGATSEEIGAIAFRIVAESVAKALYWLTGEGSDPEAAEGAPGVLLVEADHDRPTGRIANLLHEDWALGFELEPIKGRH